MDWWRRMLRRARVSVAWKEKSRKEGDGILKLHDDIQTCEYDDILVMWGMLQNTQPEFMHDSKLKQPVYKSVVTTSQD